VIVYVSFASKAFLRLHASLHDSVAFYSKRVASWALVEHWFSKPLEDQQLGGSRALKLSDVRAP
jgi:hypothetical protein